MIKYYFSTTDLRCAFGTPWAEHWLGPLFTCAGCAAYTAELRVISRAAR